MDTLAKLKILGSAAADDLCSPLHPPASSCRSCTTCAVGCGHPPSPSAPQVTVTAPVMRHRLTPRVITDPYARHRNVLPGAIHVSPLPGGGSTRLLKVLQTNHCEFDCVYCEHRASRDVPRTYLRPEELARIFMDLHRRRLVDGLFLSSGITKRVDTMQERMLATVEILRTTYQFTGYVHLKIMPGVSEGLVEASMRLANRVSVNMEAPSPERLTALSLKKDYHQILSHMVDVAVLKKNHPELAPAGQITQFVVGGAGESDQEILTTTSRLYKEIGLARAYFSAFHPVPESPLEDHPPTPLIRQHRLYQADWLMRFYGFQREELVLGADGNLPQDMDPKMAWALAHPEAFPVDVMAADYERLLRVPGIGPTSAKRIVETRRRSVIRDESNLKRLGIVMSRAAPFLLLRGHTLAPFSSKTGIKSAQLHLWSPTELNTPLHPFDPGVGSEYNTPDLSRVNDHM